MNKLLLLFLFMGLSYCATAQKKNDAAKYAGTIKAEELKEKLTILAGPEMEGRETATEGQRKAAAYIEEQFKKIGLKPGNGNSYQQFYQVYEDSLAGGTLKLYRSSFALDQHFTLSSGAMNGTHTVNEIVFAGFGMVDSVNNDYQNLDVKGKWVMIIEGAPADIDKKTPSRWIGSASTQAKLRNAKAKGAAGVLFVNRTYPSLRPSVGKGFMYMKRNNATDINFVSISWQAAASVLTKPIKQFSDLKNIQPGVYSTQIVLSVNKSTKTLQSSNVLGVLEGTDKKDEFVFLTAHYDHLGMHNGAIYYGADDDGSGTVSIIEIAEAFAQAAKEGKGPRRSIVFMAVSGEEKGLWGSEYYTSNPIFPLSKTSVDLNIDMVGRIDPKYKGDSLNYVYVIGEDKLSSDLQPITDSVNSFIKMELDRRYNDVTDPNRFYYRSDHYNFAKNGVPIIFYFNGTHADYHKASDTVDKINFDVMTKRVKLIYFTAWIMANREAMLKRDKPLNVPER